ncbi:putative amidase domain-containing protein [Bifidobacterium criceti]|uniref:Putative amidase domain-containing protein n=2 Tax=Bifidobacterium TaxID=1678 RepID=A0A2A2EHD2_9BIFI|nr:putative amidase domain-containing protein [Bifidobacterium criceti]
MPSRKAFRFCLAVGVIMFTIYTPAEAFADTEEKIEQTVNLYTSQIQSTYSFSRSRLRSESSTQQKLAEENGYNKFATPDTMTIDSAEVKANILKAEDHDGEYSVVADITTILHQRPNKNVTITIGDEERDVLDSSATDMHRLTLAKDVNVQTGYRIISDEIIGAADSQVDIKMVSHNAPFILQTEESAAPSAAMESKAGFDYLTAVTYAEKWTENGSNCTNPEYPSDPAGPFCTGAQCTYFVSQVLHVGGLPATDIDIHNYKSDDRWGFKKQPHNYFTSFTWGAADNNYRYMKNYSNIFDVENNYHRLGAGSLIYADWQEEGKNDGHIDHAMVVVGSKVIRDDNGRVVDAYPIICQKSVNRHDWDFQNTLKDAPGAKWYGLQLRY